MITITNNVSNVCFLRVLPRICGGLVPLEAALLGLFLDYYALYVSVPYGFSVDMFIMTSMQLL